MSDDAIILDVLTSGEVWAGPKRIAAKSATPMLHAARSLRGLGLPLDTPLTFRKLGQVFKTSSIAFLLRDQSAAVMP